MTTPLLRALVGDMEMEALFTDAADLEAMLRFEVALAEAEAEEGLVSSAAAVRIAEVCAAFKPDRALLASGLGRDGVIAPELIKQLRAAVGEPLAKAVHMGATSQDVIDTSLVLRLAQAIEVFENRLDHLVSILIALRNRDASKPLMAHTRMQVALPFTAGDKVATWIGPLVRHRSRLAELKPRLLVLQLGGPVGTRGGLQERGNAVAKTMAAALDLYTAPAWHSQRDNLAEFGSWLSLVSGALGKIGQDVALLAQNEIASITLAAGGFSSAMAHKRNPVAAEVLVALARFNAGLLGTLHQSLVHENERSGAAWTLEWLVLPQMVVAAGASLRTALGLCQGLTFA